MRFANLLGRACVLGDDKALDLGRASGGDLPSDPMVYVDMEWQSRASEVIGNATQADYVDFTLSDLRAPVPRPGKVMAVALNFRAHANEAHLSVPTEPAIFSKFTSSVCGPYDAIVVPAGCEMVDYEAEVVVVIGRRMRQVSAAEAWSYVGGITAGQDISDRREQRRPPLAQFSLAKSYDTFSPIGPTMCTLDEFSDLDDISVAGRLSGLEVQRGTTSQLITSVPDLLAWSCRYVTLEPGDLVFTGTPEGVGSRRDPPLYLTDGMVLETEVARVGTMRNLIHSTTNTLDHKPDRSLEATP